MASRFIVPLSRGGSDPLFSVYREMNRMFDDIFTGAGGSGGGRGAGGLMAMPSLDVHETEGELEVAVELPGIRPDDVDVRLERDVLTISGEKKHEPNPQSSNFHVMERSYGRFSRSMQLPFLPDPEQVSADFEHGVLKVRLKRSAQHDTSRRIQVRSSSGQGAQSTRGDPSSNGNSGDTGGGSDVSDAGNGNAMESGHGAAMPTSGTGMPGRDGTDLQDGARA